MDKVADVIAGITMVALVTTLVAHAETRKSITALANGYTGALRAAMGK